MISKKMMKTCLQRLREQQSKSGKYFKLIASQREAFNGFSIKIDKSVLKVNVKLLIFINISFLYFPH